LDIADQAGQKARPARGRGGLLWHRNFRLLWFGETISGLGSSMAAVGVPLLAVTVLHASTFAVSALTAAAYVPWLLIGLPAGAWVDRLRSRPLMIVCDVVDALLYLSLPVAAWAHVLTVAQVLIVALLSGAATVFFGTAYQVLLPEIVSTEDLMEGNAKLQGSQSVASISGPGLAGLAAQGLGAATALLFNAFSFLVSAACLLAIRSPEQPREHVARESTIRADIAEGLRFIWQDRLLRVLAIFPAVANMSYGGVLAIAIVFLVRVAHFSSAGVGLLVAVGSAGGVVGAMVARPVARRVGTARTLLLSVLVSGPCGLLIPLTYAGPRAAFYVIGTGFVTAGITAANVILVTFRQAYCPPGMLGRATACQRFLVYGTAPLGALLAGWLGSTVGVRAALWVLLAVFALSGTLLLTRPILAGRNLPDSPPGAAAGTV
jgi:MFS family permease